MTKWTEHSILDAEFKDVYLRTDGKRWQMRREHRIDTEVSLTRHIAAMKRLRAKHAHVMIGSRYESDGWVGTYIPEIHIWSDIPNDHPNIKFVGEEMSARWERRDRWLLKERLKDPEYRKRFKEHMDKVFAPFLVPFKVDLVGIRKAAGEGTRS